MAKKDEPRDYKPTNDIGPGRPGRREVPERRPAAFGGFE